MDLQQKAKVKWLIDGDENTAFFDGSIKSKNRKNRLHGLTINGVWNIVPSTIMNEIQGYFAEKFHERWPIRPKLISDQFKMLSVVKGIGSCKWITKRISNSRFTWKWKTPLRGNAVLCEFMELCSLINNIRLQPVIFDVYSVNTLRRQLDSTTSSYRGLIIEWSKIIPLKVRCFV